jgi:hypothetical protein
VPIVHCAPRRARVRPWLSAVAAGAVVLVALAAPTVARQPTSGQPAEPGQRALLSAAGVAPRVGRTSTVIRFQVTFHDPSGAAPTWVRVTIDGQPRTMVSTGGANGSRLSIRFEYRAALTTGSHRIRFQARTATGVVLSAGGGVVRIAGRRAVAGGSGTTGASPGGGPEGSTGDLPIGGASGPGASEPPADSLAGSSPGLVAERAGAGSDVVSWPTGERRGHRPATTGPGLPAGSVDGADVRDGKAGSAAPQIAPPAPAVAPGLGATGPGGSSVGSGPAAPLGLDLLGDEPGPFDRLFRAYPVMIATTGAAVVWAGFIVFGRRRRDGDPPAPDAVLASNAATGPEPVPLTDLVPPVTPSRPVPPGVEPDEALLPRWRRPSLLQARKTDPLRTEALPVSLTFGDGSVEPFDGMERRRIRYRLVRLLDGPDELRADEIGILDEGDEVQVLESSGTYRRVLCPDGRQGWLHRMVIGDVVTVGPNSPEGAPDGPDQDVLAAFIAARRQTA